MNNELSDIFFNNKKDLDHKLLMDYLENKLSASDKHDLEKQMVDSAFINDALEGLEDFDNRNKVPEVVQQLNVTLQKQLGIKKRRKVPITLKDQPWILLATFLILLIIIVCFIIISKYRLS